MVNREEVDVEGFPYKVGVPSGCTKWVYQVGVCVFCNFEQELR
jgi:hypothetical protein